MEAKDLHKHGKAILIILDGWGIRKGRRYNAIAHANTPNFDCYWEENPHCELHAAEESVGLPKGYMGNSEVGHTHLGAGRMIPQELLKIDKAIKKGEFSKNKVLLKAMSYAKHNGTRLHLLGLLSDGGVHSHIDHLFALLKMAKENKVNHVDVHCILDGRDTPPKSAAKYLRRLEKFMNKQKLGRIATIMGRFYAMDRDNRWNREHKAYSAMVNDVGRHFRTWKEALDYAYKIGETDEFVKPSIMNLKCKAKEGDSIIFFNFREDRARELTRAFVEGKFNKFKRQKLLDLKFTCMTQYDRAIRAPVAFPPDIPKKTMGEIASRRKLNQFRIAETEKYAHVTYFFNGGKEGPWAKEDRKIIPSPRVRTYDMQPEMSAALISKEACKRLKTKKYDLVVLNFANADMVGHTGDFDATVQAVEAADRELGKVVDCSRSNKYSVIITADHGNAEQMWGKYKTSHTLNKVPFILLTEHKYVLNNTKKSSIAQVTPTLMFLLGLNHENAHFPSLV